MPETPMYKTEIDPTRPFFELAVKQGRERAAYLGDGLYACILEGMLWLEAYNGVEVSNRVALDEITLANLIRFARLHFHPAVTEP